MRKNKGLFNKRTQDLTVGESLKISGVIALAATAICSIPLLWEYREEISDSLKSKFNKQND